MSERLRHNSVAPMPIARADRGRERDGVVRVHDAVREAEHHRGDGQPAAPQDQRRPRRVRPWCAPGDDESRREADHRGRQQPGDVQTHPAAEQPTPADVEVEVAEPAGLVTGQPAQTVVAQRQFDDAVVLRTADVGPAPTPATARRATDTSRRTPRRRRRPRSRSSEPAPQPTVTRRSGMPRRNRAAPGTPAASWPGTRSPRATPAAINHQRLLSFSQARCTQYAAATSNSTSSASGLLNRNINAATGVSANTAPASNAAPVAADPPHGGVQQRRPRPTPSSACGTSTLHGFSPNSRTDTSMTHSAAGVLSTVMALAASLDPNSIAVQSLGAGLRGRRVEALAHPLADRFHRYSAAVATSSSATSAHARADAKVAVLRGVSGTFASARREEPGSSRQDLR